MQVAMKRSCLDLSDIDYINAHGTSTPLGDELELGAVRRLFGNAIGGLSMSSTKSAIGHLLGGAGAVESLFCILAMRDQGSEERRVGKGGVIKCRFRGLLVS